MLPKTWAPCIGPQSNRRRSACFRGRICHSREQKGTETPPKTAKLLRDFLNVTAFSEIFHLIDEGQSYLVCGAGELSHGLRQGSRSIQHLQVTNRAVGSVERLKAWMSVGHSREKY